MNATVEYDAKGNTAEKDATISRRVRAKMRQDREGPLLVKSWLPYSEDGEPGITLYETRHGFVQAMKDLGFTPEEARNYARDAWNCPCLCVEYHNRRPVIIAFYANKGLYGITNTDAPDLRRASQVVTELKSHVENPLAVKAA